MNVSPCPHHDAWEQLDPHVRGAACTTCRVIVVDRTINDEAGKCVRVVHDRRGNEWTARSRLVGAVSHLMGDRPELLRFGVQAILRISPGSRQALGIFVKLVLAARSPGRPA